MYNCNKISDKFRIAESFNYFFGNTAEDLDGQLPQSHYSPLDYVNVDILNSFFVRLVYAKECCKLIVNLERTSFDKDTRPVKIFVLARPEIVKPLMQLINNAFQTGIYPVILKQDKIAPVFKSGDPFDVSNYRPISVLPLFSKIFERCMVFRLVKFVHDFSVISPNQFGFLKIVSTSRCLGKLF